MMMAASIGAPVAQMSSCAHHHSCLAVFSNSSSSSSSSSSSLHYQSSSSSPSVSYLGNLNEQHSPLLSSSKLCAFTPFSSPFSSLLACCSVSMNPAAAGKMSSTRSPPPRYAGSFSYITPGTPTNPATDFLASDVRSRASVVACSSNSAHHQTGSVNPMSEAEKEGWEKRQSEAAAEEKNDPGPFTWEWTLNWDAITDKILVGSCPRSPDDINRMVDETGIDAVLNLQSDLCFEALKIPFLSIRNRAVEKGILLERVAIRDFDHGDQVLMLPVAVRVLNMLLSRGMKVYVHCTAGINRATLTVVAYLTFIQGMELEDAVQQVKSARKVAHPYLDCWTEVRRRILDGRQEEITAISANLYETRLDAGTHGTSHADWVQAEKVAISRTFQRWLETDVGVIEMETALLKREFKLKSQNHTAAADGNNNSYPH